MEHRHGWRVPVRLAKRMAKCVCGILVSALVTKTRLGAKAEKAAAQLGMLTQLNIAPGK